MPELPEVETTRRGIAPVIDGRRIERVIVRQRALRWPVPKDLPRTLAGQSIHAVGRRGKYLLLRADTGTLLIHLGMSGSLRIVPADEAPRPHDHVDLVLDDGRSLRFHDPRRFGALLWTTDDPLSHPRLRELGPEPLEDEFNGEYLFEQSRGRRVAIKRFLMDAHVVVGVGNIYANEALFLAGIRPGSAAGRLTRTRCEALAGAVKTVLLDAIEQGGTTLRDFVGGSGEPGYFALKLNVYGRAGEPCRVCGAPIRGIRQGQRASYYCPRCQR